MNVVLTAKPVLIQTTAYRTLGARTFLVCNLQILVFSNLVFRISNGFDTKNRDLLKKCNIEKYLKVVKQKCAGTLCPGGCCPNQNWFCCPDNIHCASSEDYCGSKNVAQKLIGMAAR